MGLRVFSGSGGVISGFMLNPERTPMVLFPGLRISLGERFFSGSKGLFLGLEALDPEITLPDPEITPFRRQGGVFLPDPEITSFRNKGGVLQRNKETKKQRKAWVFSAS